MKAQDAVGTGGPESVPLQGHDEFSPSSPNQPSDIIRWKQPSPRKKKSVSDAEQNAILHVAFYGRENK